MRKKNHGNKNKNYFHGIPITGLVLQKKYLSAMLKFLGVK